MEQSKFIVRDGMRYKLTHVETTKQKRVTNGVCYPCVFAKDEAQCGNAGSDCLYGVDMFWRRAELVVVHEESQKAG